MSSSAAPRRHDARRHKIGHGAARGNEHAGTQKEHKRLAPELRAVQGLAPGQAREHIAHHGHAHVVERLLLQERPLREHVGRQRHEQHGQQHDLAAAALEAAGQQAARHEPEHHHREQREHVVHRHGPHQAHAQQLPREVDHGRQPVVVHIALGRHAAVVVVQGTLIVLAAVAQDVGSIERAPGVHSPRPHVVDRKSHEPCTHHIEQHEAARGAVARARQHGTRHGIAHGHGCNDAGGVGHGEVSPGEHRGHGKR